MKERYQVWVEKMTKKELAYIAEVEKRARERKVDIEKDMRVICDSIKKKGVSIKSLEGSTVTISQCVLSDFPRAYKHTPYGTVVTYCIEGGKPRVFYADRFYTESYIKWKFTDEAKEAILKASENC